MATKAKREEQTNHAPEPAVPGVVFAFSGRSARVVVQDVAGGGFALTLDDYEFALRGMFNRTELTALAHGLHACLEGDDR